MTEAEKAHLRILEQLPRERVHTHEWEPVIANKGGRWSVAHTRALNRRILQMRARGMDQKEISDELGISKITVSRHCRGKVKALCT